MNVELVLAPNPGLFTGAGTNTWVLESDGEVVIIDPGPIDDSHEKAIATAVEKVGRPLAVLVTHTHSDHAPLANPLGRALDVPVFGYRAAADFVPDEMVTEGWRLRFGADNLVVIYTPGHSDDHLCFLVGRRLFTGDHIMGGSSVMIEDLSSYLQSLRRLRRLDLEHLFPGHGPEIENPTEVIDWYLAHRLQRERQIVAALKAGTSSLGELVEAVYEEVDPGLHLLAVRSVAAHLRKLATEGLVEFTADEDPTWEASVRLLERRRPH